jgi:hypothetical protein
MFLVLGRDEGTNHERKHFSKASQRGWAAASGGSWAYRRDQHEHQSSLLFFRMEGVLVAEDKKYTQHFREAYRDGFKPKELSRSQWLYECTQAAIRDLDDVGDFRKTSGGALFYLLQRPSTHVVPLIKDSIQLRTVIEKRFRITPGTFPQLYRAIDEACEREAFKRGKPVNVYQFAHADLDAKTLYVALDESTMLKIDDKDVKPVPNGTDQIFFEPPNNWQPWNFIDDYYEEGIAKRLLVDTVNFAETDTFTAEEQAFLFEMSIMSTFLDPRGKQLLCLTGPSQSGKTSAAEAVKVAFAGGGGAEKISKEDAFNAAICAEPMLILDNLDDFGHEWLSEALCTATTGGLITLRELYKTNTKVSMSPRAYITITSTNVDFLQNKETLANRSIVLEVAEHKGHRDHDLHLANILKHRDEILTDLVMRLPVYVQAWREEKTPPQTIFRFAAFEGLVRRLAPDRTETLFTKLNIGQKKVEIENNSLIATVDHYFATCREDAWKVTAAELIPEIAAVTNEKNWTSRGVGRRLKANARVFKARYKMQEGKTKGTKTYTFQRPDDLPKDQVPEDPVLDWAASAASKHTPKPDGVDLQTHPEAARVSLNPAGTP